MKATIIFGITKVEQEGNIVTNANFDIVGYIDGYNTMEEIEELIHSKQTLYAKVKENLKKYGTLYVVNLEGKKFLSYECVMFLNKGKEVIIDCMESDDRVLTRVALEYRGQDTSSNGYSSILIKE